MKKGRKRKPKCPGATKKITKNGPRWYCPTGRKKKRARG